MKSRERIRLHGALRWGVYGGMFVLGLGIAWVRFAGSDEGESAKPDRREGRDLRKWAEDQRRATGREIRPAAMVRRIASSREAGVAMQVVDMIRLVRDTPPGELGDLLEKTHRELYETWLGETVCDAIVQRMKEVAPEELITLMLSGRSSALEEEIPVIVKLALEQEGLSAFLERIDEECDHRVKERLLSEVLTDQSLPTDEVLQHLERLDADLKRTLEPQVIRSLVQKGSREGVEAYLQSRPVKPDMDLLVNGFARLASSDAGSALSLIEEVPSGVSKGVLLGYVAQAWARKEKEEAVAYADGIESPVLQSHFLAGLLEAGLAEGEREELVQKVPLKKWREHLTSTSNRDRLRNPFQSDD